MKPTRRPRPGRKTILACLAGCLLGAAQTARGNDLEADQMSVRELMLLDSALAASRAKSGLDGGPRSGSEAVRAPVQGAAITLVAIYGVGKDLMAEVRAGSQSYLYVRGRALPVGLKSSASAPLLRGISGSCVHLERHEEPHTLCLHSFQRVAQ